MGEGGKGPGQGRKGAERVPRREPLPSVSRGSRMAAEGQEVTAGAAAVLARRKDRPPLPRSLREAANEETSDEEWLAAEEQCEEDHETRVFLPASKYGRVRIHQAPRAQKEGTGEERRNALLGKAWGGARCSFTVLLRVAMLRSRRWTRWGARPSSPASRARRITRTRSSSTSRATSTTPAPRCAR